MAEEKPARSTSSRGTRSTASTRGRSTRSGSSSSSSSRGGTGGPRGSSDPRVVGRRPARKSAEEEEKPKRASTSRRRPAAKSEEKTARTSSETRTTTTRRRPASGTSSRTRSTGSRAAASRSTATTAAKAEEKPEATTTTRRTPRRRPAQTTTAEPASADVPVNPAPARAAAPITEEAPKSIEELGQAIVEVRRAIDDLGSRIENSAKRAKVGVFVDVPNVLYGADHLDGTINMGKLLEYLVGGREVVRATAYSPVSDDPSEPVERQRFVAPFVPHGYRIVTKPLKRFADGSIKGNFDVEMAIDMVTMAERLDVVSIVSGDSDFARLVEVIQGRGVRVEVVAFAGSTSVEMRSLADRYIELGAIYDLISD